jgi:hypothetical protein
MHPILSQVRRLALYLLAWALLAALLAFLLSVSGEFSRREAAILAGPLCFFYGLVCLSAWYPCRAAPTNRSTLSRILLTSLAASLLAATLWILAAKLLALELSEWGRKRSAGVKESARLQ